MTVKMVYMFDSGVESVDEKSCQTVASRNELHTTSPTEEIETLKLPVVAPALYNLGKLLFH